MTTPAAIVPLHVRTTEAPGKTLLVALTGDTESSDVLPGAVDELLQGAGVSRSPTGKTTKGGCVNVASRLRTRPGRGANLRSTPASDAMKDHRWYMRNE
jgi:hypothetical protein